ncbi:HNH endonuclease [Marinagarivorans cellulosilyticus]|uniref:Type IV secretion system protein TrbI n=1 Tax=Marinagarivorans cellulosilyticus TaxID=2721545 RepID=A0AAN1WHN2_9GAMM|nr:HNH endonuclease [Marinagarivorans cellulosilyticus]BCD97739.1 type IV secretion system protein TrbI [Marinagarivorans cellulosilyticus]
MKVSLLLLLILSSTAFGHGGGLDSNGGHNDRKNGGYHCHREPCFSVQNKSTEAVEEAVNQKLEFSYIYNRDDWQHWSDFDGDCMNTRHEILLAQADGQVKKSPDGCYVSVGTWLDPFSGKTLHRASDLDVDHIVPLKWAHDHGGADWPRNKKERFANDPRNLLAVDDGLNQAKGAKGPNEWMPPNQSFRCEYLELWQTVLKEYPSLKMNSTEERVFRKQLNSCKK